MKAGESPFLSFAPIGHYYSPFPDLDDIHARRDVIFKRDVETCPGVNLRESEQIRLLEQFAGYFPEMPFPQEKQSGQRYCFDNVFYCYGDAVILYSFLRHFRPARVIEVGSGFSSAAMMDVNDKFFEGKLKFKFIEPYPDRLLGLLSEKDIKSQEIVVKKLQDIPLSDFKVLQENDILFIDSTHVVKTGSDVKYYLDEVLPALNKGVIVHFHDIFWPFEYPEQWLYEGRVWNESYFLRSFLQYNDSFEILYFNAYMGERHPREVEKHLPVCLRNPGGSLWLRKVK